MPLLTPKDDFVLRTLAPLGSVWKKLRYVANLKSPSGRYQHWGLAQVHGQAKANRAIAQVHTELLQETLATPIRSLFEASRQVDPRRSEPNFESLCPEDVGGASRAHLDYVVTALTALSSSREWESHPAA